MNKSVTMKFEVAENGLIVRKREGNKWGAKQWVVAFYDVKADVFSQLMGGESVLVGNLVRESLFGATPKEANPCIAPTAKVAS